MKPQNRTERICEQCDLKCKSEKALKKHLTTHLENAHKCDFCGNMFGTNAGLKNHVTKMHKKAQDRNEALDDSMLLQVIHFVIL